MGQGREARDPLRGAARDTALSGCRSQVSQPTAMLGNRVGLWAQWRLTQSLNAAPDLVSGRAGRRRVDVGSDDEEDADRAGVEARSVRSGG